MLLLVLRCLVPAARTRVCRSQDGAQRSTPHRLGLVDGHASGWGGPARSVRPFGHSNPDGASSGRLRMQENPGGDCRRWGVGAGALSRQMPEIDVVQYGAPVLTEARPFDLPGEREAAERCVDQIHATMERIGQVPPFAKGMGTRRPPATIGPLAEPYIHRRHASRGSGNKLTC